ncbi:MAG: DUF4334 domain-containing protein [Woeseiaceae bacterium]
MRLEDLFATVPMATDDAYAAFDAAGAVEPDFMIGSWRGAELPTGHRLDGWLGASGWWGKQFVNTETVHPLLFLNRDKSALWAFNPGFAPLELALRMPLPSPPRVHSLGGLVAALRPIVRTKKPRARLRTTRFRGQDTATMIYDQLPVNDVFRRIADNVVLGMMDLRGSAQPYFFVLQRDESLPVLL